MNMNQVTLPVTNMDEACTFYKKLGFLQIVGNPYYARFQCLDGDSTFSLLLEKESFRNGSTIYFEHEALDELVDKLKDKGIKFDQEPTDTEYLWREAELHDPSGNKIKLYWAGDARLNPPWRIEERL